MKGVKQVFGSFVEAEKSDRNCYQSLSPNQRLDMLLTLISQHNPNKTDEARTGSKRIYRELLNAPEVRYVILGAFALAYHGHPRYTGDIDFFVEPSPDNAEKLQRVFKKFDFANVGVSKEDFTTMDQVVQLGVAPQRMDLIDLKIRGGFEEPGRPENMATWTTFKFPSFRRNCSGATRLRLAENRI